jgi:adenylosuccinate lyase
MRANIVAEVAGEPMMRALASFLGRHNAHDVLHECFMLAHEKRVPILDVLSANESVSAHLGKEQLQALMDPSSYLGVAVDVARNEARRAR